MTLCILKPIRHTCKKKTQKNAKEITWLVTSFRTSYHTKVTCLTQDETMKATQPGSQVAYVDWTTPLSMTKQLREGQC